MLDMATAPALVVVDLVAAENVLLLGGVRAIDGYAAQVAATTVLLAAQDDPAQNGIYFLDEIQGFVNRRKAMRVYVRRGVVFADTMWLLIANDTYIQCIQ
jgi:hypothetical protein